MKNIYLLCAIVVLFSSCGSSAKLDKSKLIGSWRLSEVVTVNDEGSEEDADGVTGSELLSKGSILHFYPDSSYTELKGYETNYGKWSFLKKKKLKYGNMELELTDYEEESDVSRLTFSMYNDDNTNTELRFIEEATKVRDYKMDPFYSDNNRWRQKPQKKETNEEIRSRLLNYILHYAYLLNASLERNETVFSFEHSKGLIKVFQGGIGAIKKNRISKLWINCFYDEADAMKAYYLFNSYLGKDGVYKGQSTGDWVKDDYVILMALYSEIKKKGKADKERFTEQDS